MKLRNKDTMEIREAEAREDGIYLYDRVSDHWWKYELELLAGCWEYYIEPKEPLIKDERVRKIIRAWANYCGWESFIVRNDHFNNCYLVGYKNNKSSRLGFNNTIAGANKNRRYTLAELCGEEEKL